MAATCLVALGGVAPPAPLQGPRRRGCQAPWAATRRSRPAAAGRPLGAPPGAPGVACAAGKGFGKAKKPQEKAPSLNARVAKKLDGIAVTIIGDDTDLNRHVADQVAKRLRYVPLHTSEILKQSSGVTPKELVAKEGLAALGAAEYAIAIELATRLRTVTSTCGLGGGVAARSDCWKYLYGSVAVWLDANPAATEADEPQRGAYEKAEVRMQLDPSVASLPASAAAVALGPKVLEALDACLDREARGGHGGNMALPARKALYMKLGCRGDWPEIMPPEWRPDEPEWAGDLAAAADRAGDVRAETIEAGAAAVPPGDADRDSTLLGDVYKGAAIGSGDFDE